MTVKKLKTSKPFVQKPVPKCRKHVADMVYKPEEMTWACVRFECTNKQRPALTSGDGQPLVMHGDLEFVIVENPDGTMAHFIRHKEQNVLIYVSPWVVLHTSGASDVMRVDLELPVVRA